MTEQRSALLPNKHLSQELISHQNPHITIQADGVITAVNEEVLRITNQPPEAFVTHNITEFMPDANPIDMKELFQQSVATVRARRRRTTGPKDPIVKIALPDDSLSPNKRVFQVASSIHEYTQDDLSEKRHHEFMLSLTDLTETHEQASIDPLLGIPNRRILFEKGRRAVERASREHRPVTAAILDIDHFKSVNDSHGHKVGDQILKIVADKIAYNVRSDDIIGRYGGEEFGILLSGADIDVALDVCERIRVAMKKPMKYAGSTPEESGMIERSASIGISFVDPDSPNPFEDSLDAADKALYAVKNHNRDGLSVYVHAKGQKPYVVTFQRNDEITQRIETVIQVFEVQREKEEIRYVKIDHVLAITHHNGAIDIYKQPLTPSDLMHEQHVADTSSRERLWHDLAERGEINTRWASLFLVSPYSPPDKAKRPSDIE